MGAGVDVSIAAPFGTVRPTGGAVALPPVIGRVIFEILVSNVIALPVVPFNEP